MTRLSPDQIDAFREWGVVRLTGCFSRELAARWVAGAFERLARDPARWMLGAPSEDDLRAAGALDPTAPATWRLSRVTIRGDREYAMAEHFPAVWGALCDLLGGPGRIRTRFWTDYSIVSLDASPWRTRPRWLRELRLRFRPPPTRPEPASPSWHIDDPPRQGRLRGHRNGMVVIALLTDVAPLGGGTALALDSGPRVARALRDHPEGLDLSDPAVTGPLGAACSRWAEVTGEVGDVLLLHPFTLHASTTNHREARVIANPNIALADPMDLDRPAGDRSVLEEVTREWLERTHAVAPHPRIPSPVPLSR